jgi:hypothetical protein
VGRPASELWGELPSDVIHTEFPTSSPAPIRRAHLSLLALTAPAAQRKAVTDARENRARGPGRSPFTSGHGHRSLRNHPPGTRPSSHPSPGPGLTTQTPPLSHPNPTRENDERRVSPSPSPTSSARGGGGRDRREAGPAPALDGVRLLGSSRTGPRAREGGRRIARPIGALDRDHRSTPRLRRCTFRGTTSRERSGVEPGPAPWLGRVGPPAEGRVRGVRPSGLGRLSRPSSTPNSLGRTLGRKSRAVTTKEGIRKLLAEARAARDESLRQWRENRSEMLAAEAGVREEWSNRERLEKGKTEAILGCLRAGGPESTERSICRTSASHRSG